MDLVLQYGGQIVVLKLVVIIMQEQVIVVLNGAQLIQIQLLVLLFYLLHVVYLSSMLTGSALASVVLVLTVVK